jgi:hypothetical protein
MAKRSRRRKKGEDVRPADHRVAAGLAKRETEWHVEGPAFAEFDAHIDAELESLVSRWIHCAAPGSSSIRRVIRQAAKSHS